MLLELDPGSSLQYGFMWPCSGPRLNIALIMHSIINRNFLHQLEKNIKYEVFGKFDFDSGCFSCFSFYFFDLV